MDRKSCYNCKNAYVTSGYGGSYLNPAECNCQDVPNYVLVQDNPANECGWYDPVLIEKCAECGNAMNVPEYLWDIWAVTIENIPVCSHLCKAWAEAKYSKCVHEQFRIYQQEFIGGS